MVLGQETPPHTLTQERDGEKQMGDCSRRWEKRLEHINKKIMGRKKTNSQGLEARELDSKRIMI